MAGNYELHKLLDLIEEAKKIADKHDAQCATHLHMAKVEAERTLGFKVFSESRKEWANRAESA